MNTIETLEELKDVVEKVVDRIVQAGLDYTTEGNYIADYDDVSDLISEEDYHRYFKIIASELISRNEIIDLDEHDFKLDIIYSQEYVEDMDEILSENNENTSLEYINELQIDKWRVRFIKPDEPDTFGTVSSPGKARVEFWDISSAVNLFPSGQYVSTYYTDTLLGKGEDSKGIPHTGALSLDANDPSWTVSENCMRVIIPWIKKNDEILSVNIETSDLGDSAAFYMDNGDYLYIQSCDDGWDYTLYTPEFKEIDGGQLDELDFSIKEAITEILESEGYDSKTIVQIDEDELLYQVDLAEQQVMKDLNRLMQKASEKSKAQNIDNCTKNKMQAELDR